jgi:membrane protease YdiL (CAAX protease family)
MDPDRREPLASSLEIPLSEVATGPPPIIVQSGQAELFSAGAVVAEINCWRCGRGFESTAVRCHWCGAARAASSAMALHAPRPRTPAVVRLIACYSVLLLSSVAYGLAVGFLSGDQERSLAHVTFPDLVLDAVWTATVLVAMAWMPAASALPQRSLSVRIGAWLWAWPMLAGLLAVNMGYHWCIRTYANLDWVLPPPPTDPASVGFAILSICIQPAVVEELFFRRLTLGTLHEAMGSHSAVIVTAVMFGMAHLGAPLSVPVLVLCGLLFGYVRLYSRSLLLPMLLHAAHNGVILWMEYP